MKKHSQFYLMSFIFLVLLLPFRTSCAQVKLSEVTSKLEVSHQLETWIDTTAKQTIEQVAALPQETLQAMNSPMSLGFTQAAVWVRVKVDKTQANSLNKWVLELDQPLLQNVHMFWRNPQGQWQSQAGTRTDNDRLLTYNYRRPVFDLPLDTFDNNIWLRIETQTSMSSAFYLWRYDAFLSSRAQESFLWGLVFGSYMFVIIFYALYSLWSRNRLHAFYTIYISGNLLAAWLTGNWTALIGLNLTTQQTVLAMGLVICWVNFFAVVFNNRLLRLDIHQPLIAKLLIGMTVVIGLIGSFGVFIGLYSKVIPLVQTSAIALIVFNIYLGVVQLLKRNPNASLFIWGFSVFYVGVVVRYLRNMGWLEPNFWTEHSYQIGAFVHMIIMSVGIFTSYNRLQRERNEAIELAKTEHKQREQQAEFLGLVSHELRTPLTIVSSAADNVLKTIKLDDAGTSRLHKIQRAAERMVKIINGYLDTERLMSTAGRHDSSLVDVLAIAQQSIINLQEKQEHPVELTESGESGFKVRGHALQVQVAIDNLLNNALGHTVPDEPIELGLAADHEFVTITVTNRGDPIDTADLPHVFERFFRGRNAKNRQGSGIGLHLVQSIAALHNGHVLAENLPTGHCRFTLMLARG